MLTLHITCVILITGGKNRMKDKSFNLRYLTEEIHTRIKVQAAKEGKTMSEYIIDATVKELERKQ